MFRKLLLFWGIVLLLWVIGMSVLPLVATDLLYHIDDPVKVLTVTPSYVEVEFSRWSRFALSGRCNRQIHCNYITSWPETSCTMERGATIFRYRYMLPDDIQGECRMRGTVEYDPFGIFGPTILHAWVSEPFEAPE